jgi:hypothetical protein
VDTTSPEPIEDALATYGGHLDEMADLMDLN